MSTVARIARVRRRVMSVEPVADAPDGLEREAVAELLSELADVDVDRAVIADPVLAPDRVEKLTARQRETPVVGQVVKQGELIPKEEESFNHTARVCRIGPDKKLKLSMVYPMNVGRNFAEVLRALDGLQESEE